jgi:hypothetical protein
MRDGTITAHINRLLSSLMTVASELRNVSPSTLVLAREPDFVAYVRRVGFTGHAERDENRDYLFTTRSNATYVIEAPSEVVIRRYALARAVDLSVFERGVSLVHVSDEIYDGGAVHEAIDDGYVYDYLCDDEFAMVRVDHAPFADQTWHFDRGNLLSVFPSAAHVSQSTLVSMAKLLGAMREPECLPHLEVIAAHPSHFVRWAAIQATGRIDQVAAIALLRSAADDHHPRVRNGARKALAHLEGGTHGSSL